MQSPKMPYSSLTLAPSVKRSLPSVVGGDASDGSAQGRADDDGMPIPDLAVSSSANGGASGLLDELGELTTRGGTRDAASLHQFQSVVVALRALPDMSGAFRAKAASAAGWAALLFSSWRHRKYDRPGILGAERVRSFIMRDVVAARKIHAAMPGVIARSPQSRIHGSD